MTRKSVDMKDSDDIQERGNSFEMYWFAGLFLLFLFSFYLRAVLPMSRVFLGDIVHFGGNDPWYHMMLAKSTVINFQRPWFDPLTYFPHGTEIHFGPFMSWGIAGISYIVGLGHPSLHTVEVVGAFFPALLGALVVFPVYFIGREIGGRGAGLIAAAIIAVMPGQFFSRSVLGFTDHHIAEALFSTMTILFFLLALHNANNLSFRSVFQKDWSALRTPFIFSILAGISLGLYLDTWASGVLFVGVLLVFIIIQGTIDHIRGKNVEYLAVISIITFFIALLMISPFISESGGFSTSLYSLFQPIMLIQGIIFVLLLSSVSTLIAKKSISRYYFPGIIVGAMLLGLLVLKLAAPQALASLMGGLSIFIPRTGGAATVAEISSILKAGGQFSLTGIQSNFPGLIAILSPFFLALIAMGLLMVRNIKEERSTDLLVIIWGIMILFLTLAQNRFAYYYAVNIAVLSGYLGIRILEITGFSELSQAAFEKDPATFIREDLKVWHVLASLTVVLLFIYPGLSMSIHAPSYVGGPNQDWYNSVAWLENNTPDPGMDIYTIYDHPQKGANFQYPGSAYGVMSWWDYGHWIETIGHRIPNANPFQQGIGNRTADTPGSSPFFLAESEDEAERVLTRLDENKSRYLNSRYIVTDVEMARGKFYAMSAWSSEPITKYYGAFFQQQGDQFAPVQVYREPYFNSMIIRLHFFDGTEMPVGEAFAIAYQTVEQDGQQFSIIVEPPEISRDYSELLKYVNDSQSEGYKSETVSTNFLSPAVPLEALKHYRLVHESESPVTYEGQKYVKIFEHVPGAVIEGKAPSGTDVSISVPIMTNQDRYFVYTQSNISDGEFKLTVPYSTEGPDPWSTNFDTAPIGPYQLMVGDLMYEVRIPEGVVMSGGTVTV